MIFFKRKFQDAIRGGTKTQTVRLWTRPLARAGQVRFAPGVGYLRIREVAEVPLSALTEADALADGFPSLAALREELYGLYGEAARDNRRCFRVVFEFLGRSRPV
jgi:hypothetical protein